MKTKLKYLKAIVLALSLMLTYTCSSGGGGGGDDPNPNPVVITPTNLNVQVIVVGVDGANPFGDGSGVVQFTVTATDASKYGFKFGTESVIQNTSGQFEYEFSKMGENIYSATFYAYSSTNHSISKFETFTVYVEPELVWSDEFDDDGAVDTTKWRAETVPPNSGSWWNGEKQHYTDRQDNAYASDGTLKIVAKKETYTFQNSTKEYTSARLTTQDKYEFTYGRVDVRAKLPSGAGTWPAIWMLGANIDSVNWPACGEIDIMEHWGHENPDGRVASATHTTACSGGCAEAHVGDTLLSDYDTEFHVYSVEWNEDELNFLIDGSFRYRYKPTPKTNDNWPYTADQFIILNVAMGGSWFEIDPNFTESVMEVDYVRVYQ